ncbi:hypothetical protein FQA47_024539 [Oryzias melastigma]|uniref:Uncharacterized protein n=1 Tax=Oryzias melastigma TaxID=30732 RepID=A0A834FL01_ORYME|nr:hypothetical protein FQA47_024539 [Oryzias melastigma]
MGGASQRCFRVRARSPPPPRKWLLVKGCSTQLQSALCWWAPVTGLNFPLVCELTSSRLLRDERRLLPAGFQTLALPWHHRFSPVFLRLCNLTHLPPSAAWGGHPPAPGL